MVFPKLATIDSASFVAVQSDTKGDVSTWTNETK